MRSLLKKDEQDTRDIKANWSVGSPAYFKGTNQNVSRVYVTSQQACLRNVEAFCAKVGKSAQAPAKFVKISHLEYRFGQGNWSGVPNPLYVPVGSNVHFRALPEPAPDWPSGKPTWAGATAGTGGTAVAVFHQPGSNTVLAECGNTVTARVTALKVDIQQTEQYVCQQASNQVLNLTRDSFWSTGTVNWHSQPTGISGTGTNITFNPSSLAPTTYTVVASASLNTNCFDTCTVTVIKVEVVSVDATSDIGPTKINYRVIPSGVSIPSVTFTAPGMTETRANVNGDFFFTYNQSDLSYGSSEITLSYLGCETIVTVNKEGVGKGPAEEIIIATIPVGPGWVHWPISHRLTEGYARITYSAPVLPDSYTLHAGGSHVTLEADSSVTINWAHEKHRYHDDNGTYNEQAMTLYTGGPTLPPTTAYRKFYDSTDDRFFIPGKNLEGIAQMESVSLDGILPLNLANENIDQELE